MSNKQAGAAMLLPASPTLALLLQLLLNLLSFSTALENGLARTPPMGWLAWERFTCQIDCQQYPNDCIAAPLFETMAKHLVDDGYLAAGYQYVNIDDCWSEMERDSRTSRLVANRTRFPDGIGALATRLHQRGLRIGIYGDCGTKTCAGYPAQLWPNATDPAKENFFELDARTLADWQVDSFKFDGCYIDPLQAEGSCPLMSKALSYSGRPMVLICEWPFYMMYAHAKPNFTLAAESCNVWRYFDDIEDSWQSVLNTIDYTVKHQSTIVKYHGPGHWFDPDQLVLGNFGLSREQEGAQMAIWALWSAPLYMSNDLRQINADSAALLKNRHLIGVNQDPLGVWGLMVEQSADGQLQAFVKPIRPVRNGCPSFAIVYLNRNTLGNKVKMSHKLRDLLAKAPVHQAAKHQAQLSDGVMNPIDASACLERFAGAGSGKKSPSQVEYEMSDLLADGASLGKLTLDSNLDLFVPLSGVRAVRLEESTNN